MTTQGIIWIVAVVVAYYCGYFMGRWREGEIRRQRVAAGRKRAKEKAPATWEKNH